MRFSATLAALSLRAVRKPFLTGPLPMAGLIVAGFIGVGFMLPLFALGQDLPAAIYRIDFSPANQPLPRAELDALLPFHVGSPLKMEEVREAIRKLYATGRFSDVAIARRDTPEGLVLVIETARAYFISGIDVDGEEEPPNKAQLISASKLELGTAFTDEDLPAAIENMQERLKSNGFYNAQVRAEVDRIDDTEEASILFIVMPGRRARFNGLTLSGQFNKTQENIIRSTGWRNHFGFIPLPGWRYMTDNLVQTGVAGIRQSFQSANHLKATVTLDDLNYDAETNRVKPSLSIDQGPIVEVRTSGAKVSSGKLRQLIPVYQERSVDRSLLVEGKRNLLEYFQSAGYFETNVDFDQQESPNGHTLIDFKVDPGTRSRLVSIRVHGNRFFDTATLLERLEVRAAAGLRYRRGRFSQRLLDRDLEQIRELYRANGFRDIMATARIEMDYQNRAGDLAVSFEIDEGPQWRIGKLELEGIPEEDRGMLTGMLQSTAGQAFSEANVATDRDAVLSFYYNNGYPDATFDWTQSEGSRTNEVNLRFTVNTGRRQYVRSILIRGLEITNPALVADRISLKPGDPISQNQISASQQKLYDLGIFAKAQPAIQNPDNPEESKNVIFHFDEARKYSVTAGIGAELARIGGGTTTFDDPAGATGFSPRVSLGLNRINFLGLGHTIGLQTRVSTIEQRALLSYLAPHFTGKENTSLSFSALYDVASDVRTFASRRWEGSAQVSQKISRATTVQLRYTFRRVTVNDLKISPGLIPLLSQPVRVGSVSLSVISDRRDDPTNTHRGYVNSIDLALATREFGSETDFTRILFRNSTYYKLGRDLVLARSLQFGYIQRLGGLSQIPLAERFFSGGASSQRAFPDNQAGPRDLETGFPLGGNALLFHQTELRFPLIGDNLGGVLFHDMGNIYSDIRNISARFRQRGLGDFDYMVQAAGIGIRYRTPVGPIRMDLSLSPNPPRFYGFSGSLQQLLTNQGTLVNQRINIFQFHFSLGQTF
jgi:outer membrane protein insertion porin family